MFIFETVNFTAVSTAGFIVYISVVSRVVHAFCINKCRNRLPLLFSYRVVNFNSCLCVGEGVGGVYASFHELGLEHACQPVGCLVDLFSGGEDIYDLALKILGVALCGLSSALLCVMPPEYAYPLR